MDKTNAIPYITAGIIPVAGMPDTKQEINFPWPLAATPLYNNFLAVERSVYECAFAGCHSIWIVVDETNIAFIRKKLGDWIINPALYKRRFFVSKGGLTYYKAFLPIYYIPLKKTHYKASESYVWSVLWGASIAKKISSKLSMFLEMKKYFVSFPYGIHDSKLVEQSKTQVSTINKNLLFTFNNKSILDDEYLSFSFGNHQLNEAIQIIGPGSPGGPMSLEEKKILISKLSTFANVFPSLREQATKIVEVPWYYDLKTWESYRDFLKSDHPEQMVPDYFKAMNSMIRYNLPKKELR